VKEKKQLSIFSSLYTKRYFVTYWWLWHWCETTVNHCFITIHYEIFCDFYWWLCHWCQENLDINVMESRDGSLWITCNLSYDVWVL